MKNVPKTSVVAHGLTTLLGGACVLVLVGLMGCGQKGPLILPAPSATASAPAK